MYKDLRITVVIPCLNEEDGIRRVLAGVPPFVDEALVVDNGSTDRTAEVAQSLGAKVVSEEVRGYGRAYKTGLLHAAGDVIVTLDGDHSYPVDAISYLIEALLHEKVGFVSASRFPILNPQAMSFKHRVGNLILSLVFSILFWRWVRDSQSGMWVFYKRGLERMHLQSNGMPFSEEIKIEAITNRKIGFKEIHIEYSTRVGEKKLQPWRDGIGNLLFLLKKRWSVWRRDKLNAADHETAAS
ncbi:MAG: glycosyltransferase family 2 protein [Terriglobia bacterium]